MSRRELPPLLKLVARIAQRFGWLSAALTALIKGTP